MNEPAYLVGFSDPAAFFEAAVEAMGRVTRDALRASEVVGRMRALVTKQDPKQADFDVNEAIAEVLTLTQREQRNLDVEADLSLTDGDSTVYGDRIQFQQVRSPHPAAAPHWGRPDWAARSAGSGGPGNRSRCRWG